MPTLVFDIETVGESWESFDTVTQNTLTRWIDRTARSEEERQQQLTDLKNELGFSALTGYVVAIGLYDVERSQGAVYYTGVGNEVDVREGEYVFKQRSEKEMLEDFWEGARSYNTFVTFNGRSFDAPFLLHRSVACNVTPTQNLMSNRYLSRQSPVKHIDLQDELTFYGAVRRRPSLHLFCRAFGITSPKSNGVDGDDVATLFAEEKYGEIAHYNMADVIATTKLYQKWQQHLSFPSEDIDF